MMGLMTMTLAGFALVGCKEKDSAPSGSNAAKVQYTGSMHPEVVQDTPGKCPKCSMALTEKR